MVPWRLIGGEVGKGIEESGRATATIEVLESEFRPAIYKGKIVLTQSAPFLYCKECGIQKVAEMTPPLRLNDGFAARGSSRREFRLCRPVVRLIRRRISRLDLAPEAAASGDCAIAERSLLISWEK